MNKKRFIAFFVALLLVVSLAKINANTALLPVKVDLQDPAKLQRGAKFFMDYCSGCHSLRYLRYNRMAKDLKLTAFTGEIEENFLANNLIYTRAKISDPIRVSIPATDARQWFGVVPPDLSLTARERGANWIYTYLKSFYPDNSRPFGTNNLLVPQVAMPNVIAPLRDMEQAQLDQLLADLTTFLVYVAEPVKLIRYRIGLGVIGFLSIFLLSVYQLKKIYWRSLQNKL
jgi:ubiquinol-cytochrome c reductase cytochrome c1 subunit